MQFVSHHLMKFVFIEQEVPPPENFDSIIYLQNQQRRQVATFPGR